METAIVTTTINVPIVIEKYIKDAIKYGYKDSVFIIRGDKKTPSGAKAYCQKIAKKYKYQIYFLDVSDQVRYLKKYPELAEHLVYNSIQRRNIGILMAYEMNYDIIITIDDDNLCYENNFIGQHRIISQVKKLDAYSSLTGWFNVCDFLTEKNRYKFYHRGFPVAQRWRKDYKTSHKKISGEVVVNAGLWLDDPDIDAITRLAVPIKVTGLSNAKINHFTLGNGTWSPFNSQNTAFAKKIIPAYFLSPYIGRYDDIWASYIIVTIANHLRNLITFGRPLVVQERNVHNYLKDLDKELTGMALSDKFCDYLREINFTGETYQECFDEVYLALKKNINKDRELTPFFKNYLEKYLEGILIWEKTIERV